MEASFYHQGLLSAPAELLVLSLLRIPPLTLTLPLSFLTPPKCCLESEGVDLGGSMSC